MYNKFFGFRERPFRLVPDPAYLFLSKSHEEALAHLTYAISQGEGFVEITGEVGTGKTTLCRAFLEKLDEDTEVAYIFNPKLDAIQLLKAVNDEFGVPSDADNVKDLIDQLNAFLMEKKAERKKALLLIDEAQNLSPEVLEQVRLLSNLETNTEKLLQIILVGQPELADTLDSRELRQLGQRITLACHLKPLTRQETRDYIRHRINIASQKPGVRFSWGAIRAIHRYSGGIPRLINIACDRALLTAFGLNKHQISGGIARAAIRELAGRGETRREGVGPRLRPFFAYSLLIVSLAFVLYHFDLFHLYAPAGLDKPIGGSRPLITVAPKEPAVQSAPAEETSEGAPKPEERTPQDAGTVETFKHSGRDVEAGKGGGKLQDLLQSTDPLSSKIAAAEAALRLWRAVPASVEGLDGLEETGDFFRLVFGRHGMDVYEVERDLDLIRKLQLPAILGCLIPGDLTPRYIAVGRLGRERVSLKAGGETGEITASMEELETCWSGVGYVPWKNTLRLEDRVPFRLTRDSVVTLQGVLKEMGFDDIQVSAVYDEQTVDAVREIQQRHGLQADGIIGPLTKIVIHNEIKALKPESLSCGPAPRQAFLTGISPSASGTGIEDRGKP